jgi:hypothetical protein
MFQDLCRRQPGAAIVLLCACAISCRTNRVTRPYREPPPPDIQTTVIEYVDTDAFDATFEIALTNQDPVIVIETGTAKPDWGPRLNAWLAAWNRGGRVAPGAEGPHIRGQAPLLPLNVNSDTLHEFRLLVDDLLTRTDDLARRGSSWWMEERTQRRRIDLLRPYSLRFHLDEKELIQLVFFNGRYSQHYKQVMRQMNMLDPEEPEGWRRCLNCSCCKSIQAHTASRATAPASHPEEK